MDLPKLKHTNRLLAALAIIALATPVVGLVQPSAEPYEQEFVITAYYSPEPDQCCYVKGSYEADKILNGQGIAGADGTPVYPGMIAAPPSYAFGTTVVLPGLGTFAVHDRGGAIQEWDDAHRLDIWMGTGEAGLARALDFGIQRVRGTVYPLGSSMPQESFNIDAIAAPSGKLTQYIVNQSLMAIHPVKNETGYSVTMLQNALRDAGYFTRASSGYFGDETEQALAAFITDFSIGEPTNQLTEKTAAYLTAAIRRKGVALPIEGFVDATSSEQSIMNAKRLLRFIGFYSGRTDGEYTPALSDAILRFQQIKGLVGTAQDPGAGRIGPMTKQELEKVWNKRLVAQRSQRYLAYLRVERTLTQRGDLVAEYLDEGSNGSQVRLLQEQLAALGYFPYDKINGNYGQLTKDSVLKYQTERGLIASATAHGAGRVGPQTLVQLRSDQNARIYQLVRSQGWEAL